MRVIVICSTFCDAFPGGLRTCPRARTPTAPRRGAGRGQGGSGYAPGIDDTGSMRHPPRTPTSTSIASTIPLSRTVNGLWVDPYGWVWAPMVDCAWRPYVFGRWIGTDYGWTCCPTSVGAGPLHYGCGHSLAVPVAGSGYPARWGPAWVTWRVGPGTRLGATGAEVRPHRRRAHRHRVFHLESR